MNRKNTIGISDFVNIDSAVVNKKYIDNKTSKITIYKELHFKSVGRTTVWGQFSTPGFPFLPSEIYNLNSKTIITILSISSDTDARTASQRSGLLDSTIKISIKYYADDGTTKSSGEVVIGTFKMSDFRHHEVTDGSSIAVVFPMNVKYILSSSISNYTDIKYVTFGITQTIGVPKGNEVKMSLRYEDFE